MTPVNNFVSNRARSVRCGVRAGVSHVLILYRSGVLFMLNPAWNNAPAFGYLAAVCVFVVII